MADLIDRQAAIDAVNKHGVLFEFYLPHEFYEVKKEIRELPSAQPDVPDTNVGDMISRQAAIKAFKNFLTIHDSRGVEYLCSAVTMDGVNRILSDLPFVERHGKWLDGYGFAGNYYDCFVCDQCKKESMAKTNYCPNCGARMDGEHDG